MTVLDRAANASARRMLERSSNTHGSLRALESVCRFVWRISRSLLAALVLAGLVVGTPWALSHHIGWPLPHHLPAWTDIHDVLLSSMSTTFLLNVLACVTWLAWAAFVIDVARCAAERARGAPMPDLTTGPVRRIAAVLVGAVLISIVDQRAALGPTDSAVPEATSTQAASIRSITVAARDIPTAKARATLAVAKAPDPVTGVHDSLWRIAERTLGNGNRWHEIWELNKGKPQPDGRPFNRPSLIFPGQRFTLPANATAPSPPPGPSIPKEPPAPPHTEAPPTSPPTKAAPTTPAPPSAEQTPSAEHRPASASPNDEPGIRWNEGLFVGLGLATAITAALAIARRRNRRRYRPGSGDRGDLPVAPVVYQLRLAHLHADQHNIDTNAEYNLNDRPQRTPAPTQLVRRGTGNDAGRPILPIGARDGREIALDLATTHGLGLIGPGAAAATRAVLVTALAPTSTHASRACMVITGEDVNALLGRHANQTRLPAALRVATDLTAALAELEAETLVRAGQSPPEDGWPPLLLVTRVPQRERPRLQAILDHGSTVGIIGLLLGQWTPGVTALVRDDGLITTTNPGAGESLRGTSAFQLGDDHTTELLDLLHRAEPDDEPDDKSDPEPLGSTSAAFADNELEILAPITTLASSPTLRPRPVARAHPAIEEAAIDDVGTYDPERHGQDAGRDRQHQHDGQRQHTDAHTPLRITVLGPPQVFWRPAPTTPGTEVAAREVTSAFQPRVRELMVFLALHPDGASREALIAALWTASPPQKTTNALNTSLTRLRRAVTAATEGRLSDVLLAGEGRYRLDPELVEVDYHRFAAAAAARRAATTDHERIDAYRRVVDSYTGALADGLSTEWIETAREAIRRDAIDAVAALARALVDHDPQQTLDLLELARAFDPHNELIYRDIMRLQERLGQLDAIPRTLTLLTTRLAEIDDRPTPQAVSLADRLRRRHDADEDRRTAVETNRMHGSRMRAPRRTAPVKHRVPPLPETPRQ